MKRHLGCLGVAIGAMVVVPSFPGWTADRAQLRDETSARLASMRQIHEALAIGASPETWDVAVFISSGVIRDLAKAATGMRVTLPASGLQPAVSLELKGSNVSSDVGALRAHLDLTAQIAGVGAEVPLSAEAVLVVAAVEPDPDHPSGTFLTLAPRILSIGPPTAGVSIFGIGDKINRLIAYGAMKALEDNLIIRVPLTNAFSLSTAIDKTFTAHVSDTTTIDFHVQSVGEKLQARLQYRPIVTADGLWALARQARPGEPDGVVPQPVDAIPADGSELNDLNKSVVPMLMSYAPPKGALAVHIGQNLLSPLVDEYNKISADKRVITINSTSVTGRLFEKKWCDNVLGDGGVFVELTNPSAASGTIRTGAITQAWDEAQMAYQLSLPASIDATANIHVHVDPLIGGGAGTTIGMVGSASHTLRLSAGLLHMGADGLDAIWLQPDIPCQNIPVSVRTNGALKLEGIAAEVPAIGAKFSAPIGKDALQPTAIVDTIPRVFKLFGEVPRAALDKPQLTFPPNVDAVSVKFSGLDVRSASSGAWLSADVTLHPVLRSAVVEQAVTTDQFADKVKESRQAARPACPGDNSVEMVVGDIEIGKNNDFVRAVQQVGKALGDVKRTADKAEHDAEVALKKAGDDAAKATRKAADDAAAAAKKAGDDLAKAARKIVPQIKIKSPF